MPDKARLKNGQERKRKSPGYCVSNCSQYNLSLERRGMISLYFPAGDVKSPFINNKSYAEGVSGRQPLYLAAYIELIYTLYRLYGWGMRQIQGYMKDHWRTLGLTIAVPSFGHLCDRFASLHVTVKQHCAGLARRLADGEAVDIIIDSTGMSFGRASEWHEIKYGSKAHRTPWRKMHLSIDLDINVHALVMTEDTVSDSKGMDAVIPANK